MLKKKTVTSIPTKEELMELIENAPPASTNIELSVPVEELARAAEKSTFYRPSFGEVFKINRDPERLPHGFITNQNCSPLVFLEEITDFGWYKYDIVQIGDHFAAKDLQAIAKLNS
ncbi:unnamed protein product [Oikopleura dioica]|uniref:Uncharacterized protein n=1 Tax=Oikopleura dioica TaxID=34765 RepID=E4X819_OIKDI|nr:unnamed protein product [Oikopleura dioica]CBY42230.1 unnamed protein product [Oikopleura dioica]